MTVVKCSYNDDEYTIYYNLKVQTSDDDGQTDDEQTIQHI